MPVTPLRPSTVWLTANKIFAQPRFSGECKFVSARAKEWEMLKKRIETSLETSGHYMLHHPAELRLLKGLGEKGIRRLASRNHWLVEVHLHGDYIEFFRAVPAYY